jgi:hypothetical protein
MCSQHFLSKFPKDSHVLKVFPNAFLKMFPITPGFILYGLLKVELLCMEIKMVKSRGAHF